MILIDGKKEAANLREQLKQEVVQLKSKYKKVPGLTVILIGDMAPSQIYVRNKEKSANEVGLKSEVVKYPESIDEKTIVIGRSRFCVTYTIMWQKNTWMFSSSCYVVF